VNATPRLSLARYPNGQTVNLSYFGNTNDQRLQTIWNKDTNGTTISKFDYTYDPDGQIQTWQQQAGTNTPSVWVNEYDAVDQLLAVTVRSNSTAEAVLREYVYRYDAAGNRLNEQIDNGITKALHNNLNQLTNVVAGGNVRFSGYLDEKGTVLVGTNAATMGITSTSFVSSADLALGTNTVAVRATDYSNNAGTNSYAVVVTNGVATKVLAYDANGNLTSLVTPTSTNTYEWDVEDRLVAINVNAHRSEFSHDGQWRRVQMKEIESEVTNAKVLLWVGPTLSEMRNNNGSSVEKHFAGGGERVQGTNYFYTRDHLGSVREMLDAANSLQARYDFGPSGERARTEGGFDSSFGFTGHFAHQASGLQLALFRGYDTGLARWVNRDPIGEIGGLNVYAYVLNNSISAEDPFGLTSSLNTPLGAMVMAWAIGGIAGGMVGRGIGDTYDQLRGECPFDSGRLLGTINGSPYQVAEDAIMGVMFGTAFHALSPLFSATPRVPLKPSWNTPLSPEQARKLEDVMARSVDEKFKTGGFNAAMYEILIEKGATPDEAFKATFGRFRQY
jgi:RHS repeat-associated protein